MTVEIVLRFVLGAVIGGVVGAAIGIAIGKLVNAYPAWRERRAATREIDRELAHGYEFHELGPDPFDPHGDGTLRPGDPMFELIRRGAVYGRREDTNPNIWRVRVVPHGEDGGDR